MSGYRRVAGLAVVLLAGGVDMARADLTISNQTVSELLIEIYNNADGSMLVTCRTMRISAGTAWSVSPENSLNCLTYPSLKVKVSAEVGTSYARAAPCWGHNLNWKGSAGVTITGSLDGSQLTCATY